MTNYIKLVALGLLLATHAVAQTGTKTVEIRLQQRVHVGGGMIHLADVATIRGGTVELRKQLAGLQLTSITADKPFATINADAIRLRCILAGIDEGTFKLVGSKNCLADSKSTALAGGGVRSAERSTPDVETLVLNAIRAELAALWQTKSDQLSVRLVKPILELDALPEDSKVLSIRSYLPANPVTGTLAVMTVIKTDQHRPLRVTVQVEARNKSVGAVRTEGTSSIRLASAETKTSPGVASVRKPIVSKPVVVRARSRVRLVAIKGALRVSLADAELMVSGRVGEMVQLRNSKTRKTMFGRLTSPSTAVIEL